MTTIAYKDGVVAYDSRSCKSDGYISSDNFNKLRKVNGVVFFITGSIADIDTTIEDYLNGETECDIAGNFVEALVIDSGNLYRFLGNKDGQWVVEPLEENEPYAAGSGGDHAITAMDLGCTAKEAVKMAAKRDSYTGGRIRTYTVK